MAKCLLESEGIPCALIGPNFARLYHAFEVPLMVREEDAERADLILDEYSKASPPSNESA